MTQQNIIARSIKVTTPIRCDFDHRPIEKGKYATQVIGDSEIKAQGIYHGRICYESALAHYKDTVKEEGMIEE